MKKIFLQAIVFATVIFWGCNSGGGDPKAVLSQFFEALSKKDMETARKLATQDSKSLLDLMEMGLKTEPKETEKFDKSKMEFGEAKIDGDKAIVPVKEKMSGETLNYMLKKEGGSWKVAFDKATIMSMGMEKMNEKGMSMPDSLNKVLEELKGVSLDSISKGLKEGANAMDSTAKMLEQLNK